MIIVKDIPTDAHTGTLCFSGIVGLVQDLSIRNSGTACHNSRYARRTLNYNTEALYAIRVLRFIVRPYVGGIGRLKQFTNFFDIFIGY